MRRAAAEVLVERNATACEEARTPVCRCACGGKLHGIRHSSEWQRDQVDAIADPELFDAHQWGSVLAPRFRS